MGQVHRRIIRGIMAVVGHPRLTLTIAGIVLAASVTFAWFGLRISTDQNKLFDRHVAFFRDYLHFVHNFPENEAIYVVVRAKHPRHPPPTKQWIGLAKKLTAGLAALRRDVQSVDSHVPLRQLGNQALLFARWPQVRSAATRGRQFAALLRLLAQPPPAWQRAIGRSRFERCVRILGGAPAARSFNAMLAGSLAGALETPRRAWQPGRQIPRLSNGRLRTPADDGYYYIHDRIDRRRHLLLIKVYPRRTYDSLKAVTQPLADMRAVIQRVAAPYSAEFKVGVTGRPALDADEMHTTNHDTHWAETVAMLVVFLGLVLMLRSVWMAVVAEISLGVAIGWTFGFATLAVGKLNLLSIVFVIALIGIGMDYLIQILVRYRREAKRYVRPQAIWARVFRYAGPPINTACFGAAGAFAVAIFTRFTGAAELGIIAGGGLLLCLLSGYTVLPALLVLFPAKIPKIEAADRYGGSKPPAAGWWKFVGPVAWLFALAAVVPAITQVGFNSNLLSLQAPGLQSVRLVPKLPTWYAVVLSKSLRKLEPIRRTLNRDSAKPEALWKRTKSLIDAENKQAYLWKRSAAIRAIKWRMPSPAGVGALKSLAIAADAVSKSNRAARDRLVRPGTAGAGSPGAMTILARTIHHGLAGPHPKAVVRRYNAWQAALFRRLRSAAAMLSPPPLDVGRLPAVLRDHYLGRSGQYALYISPTQNLWVQHNLRAFVRRVQTTTAASKQMPPHGILTGIAIQLYHSTKAIKAAFLHTTIYALALVVVLVFFDLRRIGQTLMAVSVLALGLPMLAGVMGLLHIEWNFANFFGLPILIGAGHEYGVFLVHRYKEVLHDPRRAWRFWDASDRALLLCAFVTSSSFGFLAFARHRGIASLGLVMSLGCGCIYLAAIMVLRPLLQWLLHHKQVYATKSETIRRDI